MRVVCIWESWESVEWYNKIRDKLFGRGPDPEKDYIYTVLKEEAGYYTLEEFVGEEYRVEGFRPIQEKSEEFEEVVFEKIRKPLSVN